MEATCERQLWHRKMLLHSIHPVSPSCTVHTWYTYSLLGSIKDENGFYLTYICGHILVDSITYKYTKWADPNPWAREHQTCTTPSNHSKLLRNKVQSQNAPKRLSKIMDFNKCPRALDDQAQDVCDWMKGLTLLHLPSFLGHGTPKLHAAQAREVWDEWSSVAFPSLGRIAVQSSKMNTDYVHDLMQHGLLIHAMNEVSCKKVR